MGWADDGRRCAAPLQVGWRPGSSGLDSVQSVHSVVKNGSERLGEINHRVHRMHRIRAEER